MNEKVVLMKNKINEFISSLLDVKKYIFIYLLVMVFFLVTTFEIENYVYPKTELIFLFLIFIFGSLAITYSFKNKKEIHNIAFVIIILFGVLSVFISPTLVICDENEHFARSEMTAAGILVPEYVEGKGYIVNKFFYQLDDNRGETFLNGFASESITEGTEFYFGGFPQNPFYAYLPQALGIFIAKMLDLSVIWTMWLGRLFNLFVYAAIIRFAVKKAPDYKIPLLVVACLPMALFQAASVSADALINGLGILSIAYFIYMYKTPQKVETKDILIFLGIILLASIIKIPYAILSLLVFLLPKEKLNIKSYRLTRILPFAVIIISAIYSYGFAMNQLENTIRSAYYLEYNVNPTEQIKFMLNEPLKGILVFLQLGNTIPQLITDIFRFSHMEWKYNSNLLSFLYGIFFAIVALFYPKTLDFIKKDKVKIAFIFIIMYVGIYFIQYLTWTPVGHYEVLGVYARYMIPILGLIPLFIGINNYNVKINDLNFKTIFIVMMFIVATLILTLAKFY